MSRAVAFLILKAHSERVPGKNLRQLGGRPLFLWIIDTLLGCDAVERVVLDTDAPGLFRAAGLPPDRRLTVVDRAPALRGDDVTANALIAANLDRLGEGPILMTHATSPFLRSETIAAAVKRYVELRESGHGDAIFGATEHRARFWTAAGRPINHDPARLLPTQQLSPWHEENSTLYLFDRASFTAGGGRLGTRPRPFPTSRLESLDIDTESDWELAATVALGLQAP